MPKLVVVESPAKGRTIERFLGDGYVVEPSMGHIRDLPKSGLSIDVEHHFAPEYVVTKKEVVRKLRAALRDADELILATDEDREGEAISWHVLEVLSPEVPVSRMVFHEITKSAIEDALRNPRPLDLKLVEAQEGRRVLDRLVGYELSPVLWRKVSGARSAGRVQSVATRLVVERERARMAFRSGSYFDLVAAFRASGTGFEGTLLSIDGARLATGRDFDPATGAVRRGAQAVLLDEAGALGLADRLREAAFTVRSVETKPSTSSPGAPFTTSTLQQEAGRKLGFGSSRTMAVAQTLYEQGYITYMRTDSVHLSELAVTSARAKVVELYGADFLPDGDRRTYRQKVKNAQEAHEAIRPAGDRDPMRTPESVQGRLSSDEQRLYDLVWKRTIASQMADARGSRVAIRVVGVSSAGEEASFAVSGRTIEFPGYLRAYVEGADDPDAELEDRETPVPAFREGQGVDCEGIEPAGHTTQPPARYTEASLVKELEERGIGRPSTYAAVVGTILDRDYVWKKGTALVPTWTGFAKVQLLERYFAHLVDYDFTATMEEALDAIARGEGESEKWLHSFYFGNGESGLHELVATERLESIDRSVVNAIPIAEADGDGEAIIVRVWSNGASLHRGDVKAPVPVDLAPDELTRARAEEILAKGAAGPRELGIDPATGSPVLVLTGRYGPFVQLGEAGDSRAKPPRASLFASMDPETLMLDDALRLLSLPRSVGVAADGQEITAQNGRYGPYLRKGTDSRSLESEEQIFTVTLVEAEAIYALPKQRRGRPVKPPIAELGPHPETAAPVRVLDGRYGPYVTDGTTNATVPRGLDPASIDLGRAVDLLAERAARAPSTRRVRKATKARKAGATEKTAIRKSATRKTATKKIAKKRAATTKAGAAEKAAIEKAVTTEPATPPGDEPAPSGNAPSTSPSP